MDWLLPTAYGQTIDGATSATTDYATMGLHFLIGIGVVMLALVIGMFLRRIVEKAIEQRQGEQHKEVRLLYGRIILTVSGIVGVLAGLQVAGAQLEWFAGALGLGIGLAFQNVLGNFIAGMILLMQDKFNIGDYVVIVSGSAPVANITSGFSSPNSGTITDISARSTTLLALDGGQINVPNLEMLTSKILCYTKNPVRRIEIEIGIGYTANIKQASQIILDLVKQRKDIEVTPEPTVVTTAIGAYDLTLVTRIWVASKTRWWTIKSELTRDIFDALTAAGIDIPYPVSTLRVDKNNSDILASHTDLLENLKNIEAEKAAVFTDVPNEITSTAPVEPTIEGATQKTDVAPQPAEKTTTPLAA